MPFNGEERAALLMTSPPISNRAIAHVLRIAKRGCAAGPTVGLMSVTWIGAISLFVLTEKTIPWGDWLSRLGVLLVVGGAANLVRIT